MSKGSKVLYTEALRTTLMIDSGIRRKRGDTMEVYILRNGSPHNRVTRRASGASHGRANLTASRVPNPKMLVGGRGRKHQMQPRASCIFHGHMCHLSQFITRPSKSEM